MYIYVYFVIFCICILQAFLLFIIISPRFNSTQNIFLSDRIFMLHYLYPLLGKTHSDKKRDAGRFARNSTGPDNNVDEYQHLQ